MYEPSGIFLFESMDKHGDHGSHKVKLKKRTRQKKLECLNQLGKKPTRDNCFGLYMNKKKKFYYNKANNALRLEGLSFRAAKPP